MKVFADTFYWIALTDSTDAAHKRARQVIDDLVTYVATQQFRAG